MDKLTKCASCGKRPRTLASNQRGSWRDTGPANPATAADDDVTADVKVIQRRRSRSRPGPRKKKVIKNKKRKQLPPTTEDIDEEEMLAKLKFIYETFCEQAPKSAEMDNVKWMKTLKELDLLSRNRCTRTDADLIFTKVKTKGRRRISLEKFYEALAMVARKWYPKNSGVNLPLAALTATNLAHYQTVVTTSNVDHDDGPVPDAKVLAQVEARMASVNISAASTVMEANTDAKLQEIFKFFCAYAPASQKLDNVKFITACKSMGLFDSKFDRTQADLIFAACKPRTLRRIDYEQFCSALANCTKTRFPDSAEPLNFLYDTKLKHYDPSAPNIKSHHRRKSSGNIFDRLTDASTYTGSHKHRFDASGRGQGIAGRSTIAKGRGHIGGAQAPSTK
jgi:tubulin polymerization-promoting protein family member 2